VIVGQPFYLGRGNSKIILRSGPDRDSGADDRDVGRISCQVGQQGGSNVPPITLPSFPGTPAKGLTPVPVFLFDCQPGMISILCDGSWPRPGSGIEWGPGRAHEQV
jgi:hypothetical protein